jgi:hypothetical protein
MMRAAIVIAASLQLACVQVQDLGGDRAPETVTTSSATPETTAAPPIAPAPSAKCPLIMPREGADCVSTVVPWCSYELPPREGLTAKCACGTQRRWTCIRVRDDFSRSPIPVESMTITTASCTEGAPCGESTKCRVGKERACECMSSGRFRCERPVF